MTALWISRLARTDLHEILAHVGEVDPRAAVKLVRTIVHQIDVLRQHPRIGRSGRVPGTRELVIPDTRYIVAYRLELAEEVTILRVLHAARQWPEEL